MNDDSFTITLSGQFTLSQVQISWNPVKFELEADVERVVNEAWNIALADAKKANKMLFNGSLARLNSANIVSNDMDSMLHLELCPCDYRQFYVLHTTQNAAISYRNEDSLPRPLGVSSLVITSSGEAEAELKHKGKLILGRRSNRVALYPGYLHCVGGMINLSGGDVDVEASSNPWKAIKGELNEELGIKLDEDEFSMKVIGVAEDKLLKQPELIFETRLKMDEEALRKRLQLASDRCEHSEFIAITADKEGLLDYVTQNAGEFTPIARASVMLFATTQGFGDEFSDRLIRQFRKSSIPPLF